MRIAVIGGGASGLAAAWLLDEAHHVTLYERASMLGGHIRTLGGNVPGASLPPGVRLDMGVIEFERTKFTHFHAWMGALGVPVRDLAGGATNLYLADGRALHSPSVIDQEPTAMERLVDRAQLLPLLLRLRRFRRQTAAAPERELLRTPVGAFLGDDDFSVWLRCLLMYAYSTPYEQTAGLSAAVAVPMLRAFLDDNRWTCIPGGVSTYVDAVARSLRGTVHTGADLLGVRRRQPEAHGVDVVHRDGGTESFDAVILAVPPHRVLGLLLDPSDEERAWFGACTGTTIHTVAHTDDGPYARRGLHSRHEFDLFELADGSHGYNAYLNRLAGLPDTEPPHYGLAFDLDAEIDPTTVLHRQVHDVAVYAEAGLVHRHDVLRCNGTRDTWFAGAWLGDGLHEGAVRSACAVAERLGGRGLPGIAPANAPSRS